MASGSSSSSARPVRFPAAAAASNPGVMASPLFRSQLGSSTSDTFARPGLPASASGKPKPSDYSPDRRLGLSSASLDSPYRRRAHRPQLDASSTPNLGQMKKEIMDRTQGPQDEQVMKEWAASEAYARLLDFAQDLNDAVRGIRVPILKEDDGEKTSDGRASPEEVEGATKEGPGRVLVEEDNGPSEEAKKSRGNGGIVCHTLDDYSEKVAEWTESKPDKIPQIVYISEPMDLLLNLLDQIDAITDTVPVREARNRRFGDAAFRDWLTALEDMVSHSAEPNALKQMLPKALHPAISELASYLLSSFGDKQRLDYGTGHELSFLSFLCSLSLLGFLTKHDDRAAVLFAFTRYLDIVRRLQRKYFLEPAGSHGVWGLDDHQFLPYLFGSSQLASERKLPPRSATDAKTSEKWADEYLYLAAIHNIHTVKRGPFAEHSPLLNDISGLQDWTRVNSGLLRMWCGEVLGKRVVVQHLGFGGVLPWRVADGAEEAEK